SAFEAEHMIYLLLKLRIMIADNVGKGDLCDRTVDSMIQLKCFSFLVNKLGLKASSIAMISNMGIFW
ncbi:hypothetical protein, partial [Bathymodiolus platifrons methanotrophic gill symbiont]|uniref:hypothetical protein n=1 Tax=Bathymodiolus platifrons methanotrophic gill symbiont TaxID=113268 RepID=UPI001B7D7E36